MERKGGCCLAARYGAGGAGGQAGMQAWQMGKIMLKFRPIAPKPAAMAPAPAPVTAVGGVGKRKRKGAGGCGGGKRVRKAKKAATVATAPPAVGTVAAKVTADKEKEKDKSSSSSSSSGMTSVDSPPPPPPPAALPLMPVSPVDKTKVPAATLEPRLPVAPAHAAVQPVALLPTTSLVTVEDVTSTWRDGEPASSPAACAGDDDAPAFVSDQWGRVTWTNAAFSRAVGSSDAAAGADDVRVVLAAKGGAAVPAWGTCAGFTCRARVQYACPRRGGSLVAPCDVWRLDAGGYLWRLDLQAALSLSLGALP